MSELINERQTWAALQGQLLATVSALALTSYIASTSLAKAEDAGRPTVWIELGGQMEQVQGPSTPFTAPFMTAITPTPDVYANDIFRNDQKPAKLAFGAEGKISFQPTNSDWVFSADLRFGRSQTSHHAHQQGPEQGFLQIATFSDAKADDNESHSVLDFSVGKDVGLGRFGHDGTSIISAGVRFAQFSSNFNTKAMGRPEINFFPGNFGNSIPTFYMYTMFANAHRSFRGIGPSLSWNASAGLLGNKDEAELTVDWGVNAAVLFGRQKVRGNHTTQAYHAPFTPYIQYVGYYYSKPYDNVHPIDRSRRVTVPNLGGFAGFSIKYPNAKVSLGYRADFFFGAVDAGIDQRHTKNLGFNGPFATISIGLGG